MYDPVITIRLPETVVNQIDKLIEDGEFGTRAEFVKYAVRQTLKRYEGRSPPPLGMSKGVRGELSIDSQWLASLPGEVGILMSPKLPD